MIARTLFVITAMTSAVFIGVSSSAQPATQPATSRAVLAHPKLTVAILDFQTNTPATPELGQQIGETLTATLSGDPAYSLVDRSALAHVLQEQHINLTGVVSADQAIKVGQIVGAKILVTGKVFTLDKQIFITAKIIGTETSLVEGVVVKGEKDTGVADLIMQMSAQLTKALPEKGPRLVAGNPAAFDPVPALKQKLSGRKLPKVAVRVTERHVAEVRAARIDPAVETEIRQLLIECGFTVIDGDEKDWAKAGVEVIITGEAFSEFAAHIGGLVSCTSRAEIKAVRNSDNTVLVSDRDNNRAVDLAENLAGKTALQKSGRVLGVRLLEYFDDHLPAK